MNMGLALLSLIVILLATGFLWEAFNSRRAQRLSPLGQRVNVGGHYLHYVTMGDTTQRPIVIIEGGAGGFTAEWNYVQCEIAKFAPVVTYDRAGYGWSYEGPLPRTPQRIAEELHTLLKNANIQGPFILVGHSIGGILIRFFAQSYQDEVIGMVMIDSSHPRQFHMREFGSAFQTKLSAKLMPLIGHLGLFRLFAGRLIRKTKVAAEARQAFIELISRGVKNSVASEVVSVAAIGEMNDTFGGKPLIVVSQTPKDKPMWKAFQALHHELTSLSSHSVRIIAKNSGHYIHLEEPETVIDAVKQIIGMVNWF